MSSLSVIQPKSDSADVAKARRLLGELLDGQIYGVLALVTYNDGHAECLRIGVTNPMLDEPDMPDFQ
jgi:hypothetical protein